SAPGASALHGVRESPNFCRPNLFVDLLRSIRNARLRYVSRERAGRGRDHAHRALGVVPPAVRIGGFFATVRTPPWSVAPHPFGSAYSSPLWVRPLTWFSNPVP